MHKLFDYSSFGLAKKDKLISEDSFDLRIDDNDILIAVVCDGVGSASRAKEASSKMTDYLINNFKQRVTSWDIPKTLKIFIEQCNNILYQESMREDESPELVTTLSVIVIADNRLYGANVGDSYLYFLRDGVLSQLCMDHSLSDDNMNHVLTQAIGLSQNVFAYFFENDLEVDDRLLICTDGLYNTLNDDEIKDSMHLNASSIVKKASEISNNNLLDDTTAISIHIKALSNNKAQKTQKIDIPLKLNKGDVFDNYTLVKSMVQNDRTWLSIKDNKQFILKFACIEAIDDESASDLFVNEIRNATKLQIEHFAKAFVPEFRSARYYVMEYIEGVNLAKYIEKKSLSIDLSIELAFFLLKAEQYLIRRDLIHGDIKPENIIIHNDKFTLVDYGSIIEVFSLNYRAGTPSYLAPERFLNASVSECSEIYAIGATLYKALTNHLPYGEIEPFSSPNFNKDIKQPSSYNKKIPLWLDNIILRMLATNQRYTHYSEVSYDFNHPDKVKPVLNPNASLLEKYPAEVYRYSLIISLIIHCFVFVFLV